MSSPPDVWKITGYTMLRLGIGVSLVAHAVPALLHLPAFVDKIRTMFQSIGMPGTIVGGFAWLIPPVEVALGTLTVLGVWTRQVVAISAGWMIVLLAGSNILELHDRVAIGLLYLIVYFLLLHFAELNIIALDRVGRGNRIE